MSRDPESRQKISDLIDKLIRNKDKHEALAWLRGSKTGSYRYISEWTNKKSVAWIKTLYEAGAPEAWAVEFARNAGYESITVLIVMLPTDGVVRAKVFDFANAQIQAEGFDPEDDYGQLHLYLWFD